MSRRQGNVAEDAALKFLQAQGLVLLDRNYHCRGGEIDLIMRDQAQLVFVEVRYRKHNHFGHALETVDIHKQQKILHTAEHYLMKHAKQQQQVCRFDVLACQPHPDKTDDYVFEWVTDAFQ